MEHSVIDENEGKVVSASGHLFLIENGIRRWLSTPPDDYIRSNALPEIPRRKNGSLRRE
tara:strand:- start:1856 stop:2032 length:177 start_codon:yes stop_codon:yes gene_type:complete